MRLRTIEPSLPTELLEALDNLGIRTDADLIFYGTPMDLYKKLPLGTVSLAALTKHIDDVIQYVSAPGIRGDKVTEKQKAHRERHKPEDFLCGVPQLDGLLNGFGDSRVIEISGDRGSGKTVTNSSTS